MSRISHQYRHHKASGRAFVMLGGKRVYLGKYGSEESKQRYRDALAEWRTTGQAPTIRPPVDANGPTVNELLVPYLKHCETYYVRADRSPSGETTNIKRALRVVKRLFGDHPVATFCAEMLDACRDEMIRMGWCRTSVNANTYRIRRAFKWGVRKRLVPVALLEHF